MRKLKSQIIYSFVRVDTVLNSNKVHSGEGPGTERLTSPHKASTPRRHTGCLFSTDRVGEHTPYTDLRNTHSCRHSEALLHYSMLRTVCCEVMAPLLFCLQLEVAKLNSITKAYTQSYSLDADSSEGAATYLWLDIFKVCLNRCG